MADSSPAVSWFDQNAPSDVTASDTTITNDWPSGNGAQVSTQDGTTQNTASSGPPTGGNLSDPNYAAQLVAYYANQPGANPSLKNDPNYWINKITSGELGTDTNYIVSKFMTPEGAPAGSTSNSQYAQGGAFPAYTPPSYSDFLNSPGLQFGLDQGLKSIQAGAAGKGTLLTGGTLKDLSNYATNYGLTQYGNVYNQALQTNQQNQSINQGNFSNLYNLGQLGITGTTAATS